MQLLIATTKIVSTTHTVANNKSFAAVVLLQQFLVLFECWWQSFSSEFLQMFFLLSLTCKQLQ